MRVEIAEAVNALPKVLALVAKGESVVLCDQARPIAEIRPFSGHTCRPRPIGLAKGRLTLPSDFFKPLPEDLVDAFEGRDG